MLNNTRKGIMLMVLTTIIFAIQDGISRHLAGQYGAITVVMLRYWFFAAFVIAISASRPGGVRRIARTSQPFLQIFRGVLLVAEICVAITAFVMLGLVEAHAVFASYPLIVAALSGPVLGESVGWRRWLAIFVGMIGVFVLLNPGEKMFSPAILLGILAAVMFALYSLLTRYAARKDSAETSFFWTGVSGAVAITIIGVFFWTPLDQSDWGWMAALCVGGALGHYTLIKAYEAAEASTIQPFAYFQLLFASTIGVLIFADILETRLLIGGAIIVSAGLFALFREKRKKT
ncbi:MAG: DMT family transporter [Rhodobacteraceae bacterium]|nr:DMT family transporter [Paracoccaceae bacterium]